MFYGPEWYFVYLTDHCRFLNCSVMMGGMGVKGFVMNSEVISGGRGNRSVMNHNGPIWDWNRGVMNS